ncbi:MAG: biosynthetic arginine decarboxylase [Gammaproteobacteria bacterium]
MGTFTTEQAAALYNMGPWSEGYFSVSDSGTVLVHPQQKGNGCTMELGDVVAAVKAKGYHTPLLLRFMDILIHRQKQLRQAFMTAKTQYGYEGHYKAIYPIKVNQQRTVIEGLMKGQGEHCGLEAGSKPELMAILGLVNGKEATVVCNGYKDREYIRLALIGQQMGLQVIVIVEKLQELTLVLEEAKAMKVQPVLGLRVRLQALGEGKWQNTGGEKGKFGLTAVEILRAVEILKHNEQLSLLQCLHFHMGSQIPNIVDIKQGLQEAARYFVELHRLGANIAYVDVGGGLGVDYEATQSRSYCSLNYSLQEYANSVVQCFAQTCEIENLPQPFIFTEVGRAMTAHHAVLVTDIIAVEQGNESTTVGVLKTPLSAPMEMLQSLVENTVAAPERYHSANYQWKQIQQQYVQGILSLEERAEGEILYRRVCEKLCEDLNPQYPAHREILDELHSQFSHKYIANFSVFQSLPDVWAIDQVFPVVPITGLNKEPKAQGVIHDITCDSDGRLDAYVNAAGIKQHIPLPHLDKNEPLLLGVFLVGAYQEMLGDIHNLFGDPHAVDVVSDGKGGFILEAVEPGDKVSDVLRMVHIAPENLRQAYEIRLNNNERLGKEEKEAYLVALEQGLEGYTYFEE